MHIRKNDEVLIIRGDDRGKKGKVHRCLPRENRLLVEGINMRKRHMKPRANIRQAGIIELEAPIHISKVMLVCSKCHEPTRVGYQILDDRSKVRVCGECGEVID
jgi:large subunit ribosomal protein L24